eukprot:1274895-Amphidinium_carterae.2
MDKRLKHELKRSQCEATRSHTQDGSGTVQNTEDVVALSRLVTKLDEWMAELGSENLKVAASLKQVREAVGLKTYDPNAEPPEDGCLEVCIPLALQLIESRLLAVERGNTCGEGQDEFASVKKSTEACEKKIVNLGATIERTARACQMAWNSSQVVATKMQVTQETAMLALQQASALRALVAPTRPVLLFETDGSVSPCGSAGLIAELHENYNSGNFAENHPGNRGEGSFASTVEGSSPLERAMPVSGLQVSNSLHDTFGIDDRSGQGGHIDKDGGSMKEQEHGSKQKARRQSASLGQLKIASVNARSLLCEKNPDLLETARMQLFRKEMVEREVHIAFVQETKIDAKWVRDCAHFEVVAASPHAPNARARVGGLQIFVAKAKGLKVLWAREFSYRVLTVGVLWQSEKWLLLNAYAPTSAAPFSEFEAFWTIVLEAVKLARKNGYAILAGVDLNTRLGSAIDDLHVGEAVFDAESGEAKRRAELVATGLTQHRFGRLVHIQGITYADVEKPP